MKICAENLVNYFNLIYKILLHKIFKKWINEL